jgi:hypothetical protein
MKRQLTELEEYYEDEEERRVEALKKYYGYYDYDEEYNSVYRMSSDFLGDFLQNIEFGKLEVVKDMFRVAQEYSITVNNDSLVLEAVVWDQLEVLEYLVGRGMNINKDHVLNSSTSPKVTNYLYKNGYDLTEAEKAVEPDDEPMIELYKKFKLIEKLKAV